MWRADDMGDGTMHLMKRDEVHGRAARHMLHEAGAVPLNEGTAVMCCEAEVQVTGGTGIARRIHGRLAAKASAETSPQPSEPLPPWDGDHDGGRRIRLKAGAAYAGLLHDRAHGFSIAKTTRMG